MEVLLLNGCELTNESDVSMIIRKSKEDKDKIVPDQAAAKKLREAMVNHKNLITLELEDNDIDPFILLGVKNRLKVNRALRHGKVDFNTYVDDKFGLSASVRSRRGRDHTTSVKEVDYGYFPRERVRWSALYYRTGKVPSSDVRGSRRRGRRSCG